MKKSWKNINNFGIRSVTSWKKKFNRNPVDKEWFVNTRIKCCNSRIRTIFYDNREQEKAPKMGFH